MTRQDTNRTNDQSKTSKPVIRDLEPTANPKGGSTRGAVYAPTNSPSSLDKTRDLLIGGLGADR
jgi:hypothetical protein